MSLAPLPELWLQYYHNRAKLIHQWWVPLQARWWTSSATQLPLQYRCRDVLHLAYRIDHDMMLKNFLTDCSTIQDKYVSRHALAIITIWLKIRISVSHEFQVRFSINEPLVFSISQILKDDFCNLPMVLTRIWLVLLENMSQKSIVKLLTVEQPSIVINLLINKIYF